MTKNSSIFFPLAEEESELFHAMMGHIADEVLVIARDGRVVFANRAALRSIGGGRQGLVHQRITDVFRGKISRRGWEKKFFEELKKKRRPVSYVLERAGRRGKVHAIDMTAVYMPYKSGEYILSVGRDISRRRQLEGLVRESEKMETLRHFIAGMVREIQHPLRGLWERSHALVEKYENRHFEYIGYKEFTEIMRTLGMMRDQVKYCCDTTNRLLDFNRRKAKLKDDSCDVNALLREIVEGLRHGAEAAETVFDLKLAPRLPPAAVGTLELSEVLTNIITNAVQSMRRGGRVGLRTAYQASGDQVRIECRDEGAGIPEELLPHIFDPFFTTRHRGFEKKLGLGLAITNSIVKAHRGEIVVKSKLRQGTLVQVYFPACRKRG